jgi:hypothetical protein
MQWIRSPETCTIVCTATPRPSRIEARAGSEDTMAVCDLGVTHGLSSPPQNASILANDDECTECRASRRGGAFPVAAGGDVPSLVHRENPAAASSHPEPRDLFRLCQTAAVGRPRSSVLRVPAAPRATAVAAPRPDRRGATGNVERSRSTRSRRGTRRAPDAVAQPVHTERMVATALVSWLGRSRRSRSRCARAAR